jgi:hypothetical protein
MDMKEEIEGFEGPWWRHPPMRNALTAGVLTGAAFVLGHLGTIGHFVEITVYIIAILLGGYHWAREGIEEFIKSRRSVLACIFARCFFASWALTPATIHPPDRKVLTKFSACLSD